MNPAPMHHGLSDTQGDPLSTLSKGMSGSGPASERRLLHTRAIHCQGFLRSDGLIDVEGRLCDRTPTPATLTFRSVGAGEAIHDMRLVMTIDLAMQVHRLRSLTAAAPTPYCAEVNGAYSALEGLRIGAGFRRLARERLGGIAGCTHLNEMVSIMAGAAVQVALARRRELASTQWHADSQGRGHWIVDTCHAYRRDGEAVQVLRQRGRLAPEGAA